MKKIRILFLCLIVISLGLQGQSFTVNSPHAGAVWKVGQHYTIAWEGDCSGTSVKINIFRNSTDPANFVEQLTGPNNGSMGWTIPDSYTTGNYILRVKDENNCKGDSGVFKIENVQFHKVPETKFPAGEIPVFQKPDLLIESMTLEPMAGSQTARLLLRAKLKNIGRGPAPVSRTTLLILGTKSEKTYRFDLRKLAANETYDYVLDFNGQPGTPGGTIHVIMVLNVDHAIKEPDYKNNKDEVAYTPSIGPDLTAYIRHLPNVSIGVNRTITFEVRNIGNAPAPATRVKTYITDKGTTFYNVGALPPGGKWEHTRNVKWYKKGTKTVSAEADRDNVIPTEPKGNNIVIRKLKARLATDKYTEWSPDGIDPLPDLTAKFEFMATKGFLRNQPIQMVLTIKNQGATKSERTEVALNVTDHDGKVYFWDPLLPGESKSLRKWFTFSSVGVKVFQALIDYGKKNTEDHGNNEARKTIQIQ